MLGSKKGGGIEIGVVPMEEKEAEMTENGRFQLGD